MKWLGLLSLVLSAALSHGAPPNIVFILVDDLGWGDLSCYGQEHWETRRIDEMAREGMRFTQAYAGSTVCAPSRATLMTGEHTGRVFMRGNGRIALRPDPLDITIATRLRGLGYRTAMIGKSSVACRSNAPGLPNEKGFEHFFGLLDHAEAHRNYPRRLVRNGEWVEIEGNNGKAGETYANGLFVEDAIHWIREQDERPFFLHLSLTPPHADLTVPQRYMEPFRGRFEEKAHTSSGYFHQREPRAAFAGMVAFVDEAVGRVLDTLREEGLGENTVVFFASDNGPHSEGGADAEFFDSNGPWRGGKRDLYEGGIRVPQIVWWPGTVGAGVVSEHLTAFWDFPATALELAGADVPREMNGMSIVPTLMGRPEDQGEHAYLYWEFYEQGGKQAVRYGRWKGVRLNAHADPSGPLALYDLEADPGETRDVSGEHPRVVQRMARFMDHAHEPSPEYSFGEPERSISRRASERRLSNEHDRLLLDRGGFRVVRVSSESGVNGMVAGNVLDDDIETRWHSEWRDAQPGHPHTLVIDLGREYLIWGVRLMARQDGTDHGTIKSVEVFVPDDAGKLGDPAVVAGLRFTKDEQEVLLPEPVRGRYLGLRSVSAWGDSPFASLSNVEVLGEE